MYFKFYKFLLIYSSFFQNTIKPHIWTNGPNDFCSSSVNRTKKKYEAKNVFYISN